MGLSFVLGMGLGASFDKTIKQASSGVKRLGKQIAEIEKSDDFKLGRGLEQLTEKARTSNRELREARKRLADLKEQAAKSGTASVNMARRIDQAERAVKTLAASTTRYRSRLRDQVIAAQDAGHSVSGLRQEYVRLGAAVDKLNAKQRRRMVLHQAGAGVRRGIDNINTFALGAAIAVPAKDAIEFEDTFAGFEKVASGTEAQIQGMKRQFLGLGDQIAMTNEEFVDIGTAAAQGGVAMGGILDFTKDAARMGVAFDMTGEKSGQMMTAWRNGMGLTQDRVVSLGDAINHLSNNMASEADSLGELMQRQGAVGKSAGFNEKQFAALGSAILATGTSTEIASTGVKNLSTRLTMGVAATKEQQAAFNALSMDAEDVATRMQEDAPAAVLSVIEAIQALPKEMRSGIMVKLFGQESLGAIMPLVENTDLFRQALRLVADESQYAGSMMEEFSKKNSTARAQLQMSANTAEQASISLGDALIPVIKDVASEVTLMVSAFADWARENQGVVKGVAALGAGLIGLKVGMFVLSPLFKMLGGSWKLFRQFRGVKGGGGGLGGAVPVQVVNGGLGVGLGDGVGKGGWLEKTGKRFGAGRLGRMGRGLGKAFKPLGIALSAGTLLTGLMSGDAHAMGSSIGDIGGGLGGTALGAAIGTAVLPGIGTAIGGVLGGMGGGLIGEWLGDKVGGWFGGSKQDYDPVGGDLKIEAPFEIKIPEGVSKERAQEMGRDLQGLIQRTVEDYFSEQKRLSYG